MPKRRPEDLDFDPSHRQDSGIETKSRSGRVVKPKVYNDGTVALLDAQEPLPSSHPSAADRLIPSGAAYYYDQDHDDLSDISEGSFGSSRSRLASKARNAENARPLRRPAARPAAARGPSGYGGGGVFKQAAVEVLRVERRLMSTGDITKVAIKRGLVKCTGKTPEATMASALYTDIKRKEANSVFVRPREGLFGLREWVEEGLLEVEEQAPPVVQEVAAAAAPKVLPSNANYYYATYQHQAIGYAVHDEEEEDQEEEEDEEELPAHETSGDRLMELLCAAEEINKTVPLSAPVVVQKTEQVAVVVQVEKENSSAATTATATLATAAGDMERNASVNLPMTTTTTAAAAAAAVQQPTPMPPLFVVAEEDNNQKSAAAPLKPAAVEDHHQSGKEYLSLAKSLVSDPTSMIPSHIAEALQFALSRVEEAVDAVAYGSNNSNSNTTTANNNTLRLQKLSVAAPNSVVKPQYQAGPMPAPTPLAAEDARAVGPFAPRSAIVTTPATAVAAAGSDVENEAEPCSQSQKPENLNNRVPLLPTVAAV